MHNQQIYILEYLFPGQFGPRHFPTDKKLVNLTRTNIKIRIMLQVKVNESAKVNSSAWQRLLRNYHDTNNWKPASKSIDSAASDNTLYLQSNNQSSHAQIVI